MFNKALGVLSLCGLMAFLPSGCHTVIGDDGNDAGTGSADAAGNPEIPDQSFNSDAFWAQDPPPMYCGLDGGMLPPPPPPGGTPQCPDDKNRQGCPCNTPGDSAACWPGLRKNRGLGICKDGTTSCIQTEVGAQWGQCVGYVLPDPGATSGADACECFSAGTWALNNLVPCFYTIDGSLAGASSSLMMGGMPTCPSMSMTPLTLPSGTWSIDTITVDCIGHWKLCYTLKAGDASNPQPTDCVMASTCTEGNYTMVNMSQPLPDLPAWVTTTSDQVACAEQFTKTGGYGEMSVDGTTVTCEQVQKVFNRVNYCPLSCNTNPMDPACMGCGNGGSGTF